MQRCSLLRDPCIAHGLGHRSQSWRNFHRVHDLGPSGRVTKKYLTTTCQVTSAGVGAYIPHILSPQPGLVAGVAANTAVYILGNRILLRGLSLDGYMSSWILGSLSFSAFGVSGYSLVCLYFIIGSWATKVKMDVKIQEGTAEAKGGRRGVGSVLGSGLAGIVCACLVLFAQPSVQQITLLKVGFVASFCSKLSDTVSSEIGKAYGKSTYLATTFKPVPRGTEGAVSAEGTLAGVAASLFLGTVALLAGFIDIKGICSVIVASFAANYVESVIGAVFQDSVSWLTNDVVNMIQICLASVFAMLIYTLVL